jgi:regulator of RNase E activity RraA
VLDDITIQPSDLVFADQDGVVIIPRSREVEILRRALARLVSEHSIVSDVCHDIQVEGLVEKYGFF